MKFYNRGEEKNKLIDYAAFVRGLRLPLAGRRLDMVKQAFAKIAGGEATGCVTVGQAKAAFAYEEFDKFCELMEVPAADDACPLTWEMFADFYADISMATFDDAIFVKLVEDTWQIAEPADATVTKEQVE